MPIPPSTEPIRVTSGGAEQEEQRVTASALPPTSLWIYDSQANTVTVMPRQDVIVATSPELEQEFQRLASRWREETAHLSVASQKANNFNFHQILGMGEKALPFILRELQTKTTDWFWALRAIARDRAPRIEPEDQGQVRRIADIWIQWGKDNGYINS